MARFYFSLGRFKLLSAALLIICFMSKISAEGTKELQPQGIVNGRLCVLNFLNNNGTKFAMYGAPEEERLHFDIKSSAEVVYFGFGKAFEGNNPASNTAGNVVFRIIRESDGAVVYVQSAIPTAAGNPGFISTYNQAANGPLALQSGGYSALQFTPPTTGRYYIEFSRNGYDVSKSVNNNNRFSFQFFDLTVANGIQKQLGRLWSKTWDLNMLEGGNTAGRGQAQTKFYAYTADSVVTTLDLNGMRPYGFTVVCNRQGRNATDPFEISRMSSATTGTKEFYSEYPIFLNNPDEELFPSGQPAFLTSRPFISGCPSNDFKIIFSTNKTAYAEILVDLDGNPGPDYGTRDVIITDFLVPGQNEVNWDGNDGFGVPVPVGTKFTASVSVISGLTNFPIYDAEFNEFGFDVGLERPAGSKPLIYYDDTAFGTLPGDGSPKIQLDGEATPGHSWTTSAFGNERTINTWWYTYTLRKKFTYEVANNCPPDAIDDAFVLNEDAAFMGNVAANDTDPESGILTVKTKPVKAPANGTVELNADGTFTYTPNKEFAGTDSFDYQICDNGIPNLCSIATASFTINPVNDAPVALNDTDNTAQNTATSGNVLNNDYDKENSPLTVKTVPITPPSNGVLILNADGTYSYTPNNNFNGIDTFTYEVCDNGAPTATTACSQATVTIAVGSANKAPVATNDVESINEGASLSANVLSNDTDPEGNTLEVNTIPTIAPSNGTLTLNTDGSYVYTPNVGFFGTDTFSYQVCDDGTPSQCAEGTVSITVNEINEAPVASNDSFSGPVDTVVGGNVLDNDSDPDGNALSVNIAFPTSLSGSGSLGINANGTFAYEPAVGETGTITFEYQVCDNYSPQLCSVATVTIIIGAANNPPVADNDEATVNEEAVLNESVIGNDFDPDGDALTYTLVTPLAGLTFNADGSYAYSPAADFNGTVTFEYQVCDDDAIPLCTNALVTITVSPTNDAPVASADPLEVMDEDNILNSTLTDLVTDVDDAPPNLTYSILDGNTAAANGMLIINADGMYTFAPNANFNGSVTFEYQVCDDGNPALCDAAFVTISINPVNDAPLAVDDAESVLQDMNAIGNVLTNDIDVEGATLQISGNGVFNFSGEGVLTIDANGDYNFDPEPAFLGVFTYNYTVCDQEPLCASANLVVTVNPPGNPIATNDVLEANQEITATGNVLANDSDPEGDPITVSNPGTYTTAEGTLTLNANGTFDFVPDISFFGVYTFTYTVCDDNTIPNCSDADLLINYNGAPVALDDNASTNQGTPISGNVITANDTDPEGDPISLQNPGTFATADGSITLFANGSYTYTPNAANTSSDSYIYTVCDSQGACSSATLFITINARPEAVDENVNVNEDDAITGASVTANVTDANDVLSDLNFFLVAGGTAAANGTLVFNSDGSYDYTPAADFNGSVSFEYRVCDDASPTPGCDQAFVNITVNPVNDAPVAANIFESGTENNSFNGNLSTASSDIDDLSADLIFSVVGGTEPDTAVEGTLTVNPDGTYSFAPIAGFTGNVTFDYQVCDDETPTNACATATVTLTINPAGGNAAPVAGNDTFTMDEEATLTANVSLNDGDPDDAAADLVYTLISGGSAAVNGALSLNTDGSFTYDPNTNFNGLVTFDYQVCDDEAPTASCDNAIVSITVNNVNDMPVANDDLNSITEDEFSINQNSGTGLLTVNDSDVDGDVLFIVRINSTTNQTLVGTFGTLLWNTNGSYTYELDNTNNTVQALTSGQILLETFLYVVADGNGGEAQANLEITINGVDDAPVALDATLFIDENTANSTSIHTVIATDDDNDIVDYAITAGNGAGGFAINNTTGEITVADASLLDFEITNSFILTVTVTDNNGSTDTATITINLNDLNDESPLLSVNANTNLQEGNTIVQTAAATDADAGDTQTFSISGTDAGLFTINPSTGELVFASAPDFENPLDAGADNMYDLIVTVTDANGNADTEAITVTVTDQVEVANFTIDAIADVNVSENSAYTSVTPNLSGDSPIGTVTYTLSGADAAQFTIDPSTGVASMTAKDFENPVDADGNNDYEITITATDEDGNTDSEDWVVTVTNENDNSPVLTVADQSVAEGNTAVFIASATDDDAGDVLTYSISGTDAALFNIDANTGELIFIAAPDFENPQDAGNNNIYNLNVTVTDLNGNSDTEPVIVTVTDVNEASIITLDANNSGGGVDDGNFESTFDSGDAALVITDGDAAITDIDDTQIASLTIVGSGLLDGNDEELEIGGVTFALASDQTTTATVGGTTFDIIYTAASNTFLITNNAGGDASIIDFNSLITSITYLHTNGSSPNEGDRTFSFTANDGLNSNTVIATVAVNDVTVPATPTVTALTTNDDTPVISGMATIAAGEILDSRSKWHYLHSR